MKRIIVLGLLATSLGVQIACSSDDKSKIVYIVPDSGAQTDNPVCDPKEGTPQTQFNPVSLFQARCTDDQIIALINDCAGGTTSEQCTETRDKLGDCDKCLVGSPTDQDAHPFYQFDANATLDVSVGACMLVFATKDQNATEVKCAQAFGQVEVCSLAACVPACLADENSPDYPAHFDSCLTAVGGTSCTTGFADYDGQACNALYAPASNTFGFCTSRKDPDGADVTAAQYFFNVGVFLCGKPDAPSSDAGTDSGTDSGTDAGIQDAATDG